MDNKIIIEDIRNVLQKFQDGYTQRDLDRLDEFVTLFIQDGEAELIGIGAFERGGVEWFEGVDKIREIIQSDWKYWGEVKLETGTATITIREN